MKRQVTIVVVALVLLVALFAIGRRSVQTGQVQAVQAMDADHSALYEPDYAMRLGPADARVVVVEFFDPACGTCAEFAPIMKQMVEQGRGRIQLVERYAPFHPGSEQVVAVLEAAREQDRYWDALHVILANQSAWASHDGPNMDVVMSLLEQAGLDRVKLAADMRSPVIATRIQQDIADARKLGVQATPEFFVNGKPLPTWGLQQLRDLVQSELARNYPAGG